MNDIWWERSTTGFDRAQSHYDHMEPKEYPECEVCDGTCHLDVASVLDVDGKELAWPDLNPPQVECPWCVGGEKQWDGDWEISRRDSLADLPR